MRRKKRANALLLIECTGPDNEKGSTTSVSQKSGEERTFLSLLKKNRQILMF